MTIIPFLEGRVFGPEDIKAMSTALEDVCKTLNLADEATGEREQIIVVVRQGERNAALLRDRMLREIATPEACRRLVSHPGIPTVSRDWPQTRDQGIGGE